MSYIQSELYQDFAESEASKDLTQILDIDEDTNLKPPSPIAIEKHKKATQHVFQALHYLKKVVNHPMLVMKREHPKYTQIQTHLNATRSSLNDYRHSGKLVALRELLLECGIGTNSIDEFGETTNSSSETCKNNIVVLYI